jgi:hypothetical protein
MSKTLAAVVLFGVGLTGIGLSIIISSVLILPIRANNCTSDGKAIPSMECVSLLDTGINCTTVGCTNEVITQGFQSWRRTPHTYHNCAYNEHAPGGCQLCQEQEECAHVSVYTLQNCVGTPVDSSIWRQTCDY